MMYGDYSDYSLSGKTKLIDYSSMLALALVGFIIQRRELVMPSGRKQNFCLQGP